MKKELGIYKDPKSPVSEIFRTLRTNIEFMNTTENSKTILITSTFPGEGKSLISSNLAATFAQIGKKILLIDSDMRKGRQYSIFGLSKTPGLSNYLSGMNANKRKSVKDYIQKTEIENLDIMVAGTIPPNPAELLTSVQMVQLLGKVKKLYDIIIIDGTPCQLVADSLIIARIVDYTILVAAYKSTKKNDLQRVITSINNVGGKIFGLVLNKIPFSAKKYGQSYYYGSTSEKEENIEIQEEQNQEFTVIKRVEIVSNKEEIKKKKKKKVIEVEEDKNIVIPLFDEIMIPQEKIEESNDKKHKGKTKKKVIA